MAPPTPGMLAQVEELKNSVLRILCRMVKLPSRRLCALWYHAGVERKRLWRLTPPGENSFIFVLGVEDKWIEFLVLEQSVRICFLGCWEFFYVSLYFCSFRGILSTIFIFFRLFLNLHRLLHMLYPDTSASALIYFWMWPTSSRWNHMWPLICNKLVLSILRFPGVNWTLMLKAT